MATHTPVLQSSFHAEHPREQRDGSQGREMRAHHTRIVTSFYYTILMATHYFEIIFINFALRYPCQYLELIQNA